LLDIINSLDSLNNNFSVQSININSLELTIQQKEDALAEAKRNLSDYYVYAPFSGIVANFDIKKGESLSNGTVIASILTKQKIAEITLNEVDITNVKIGQKADITFDVIEDLHIPGEVVDIDTLATVTQGVVNYGVKVVFDTQDERVKPGMSVSVSIVTNSKTNILVIPNSAIKEQNNKTYVEKVIFVGTTPKIIRDTITVPASKVQITMTSVQLGLVDDMYSEVLSGLKEGDKIVLQTIASNSKTTLQTRNSLFQMPGMGSTGGMGSPTRSFRP
jgi:HlyD family secretion protein